VIVAQGSEATADGCSIDVDNRRRTNKPHNFTLGRMREPARGRLSPRATAQER